MSVLDTTNFPSRGHLALLEKWANADPGCKAVNLLICRMIRDGLEKLFLIESAGQTRIEIPDAVAVSGSRNWPVEFPIAFTRIRQRLTFMANPPSPWWHRFPGWYRINFRITERIDRWFWRPRLMEKGKIEMNVLGKPFWVLFIANINRIELRYTVFENCDAAKL